MKVAVTYEDGNIFQHFGHTSQFKVYEIEDDKVVSCRVVGTNGNGHGALATLLKHFEIDALICGGIGGGAQNALAEKEIKLYGGVQGSADEAVKALIKGELDYDPDIKCDHHEQHSGGECGQHGCGHGSCK
ncbi:MAG: NifB/NifX family molybdenum-iron cluster-binding protein [Firmicutes bacterium]|nr:NifB/NifX family molybdenum-iron cluster-binding protein [Bacillota bacterium]